MTTIIFKNADATAVEEPAGFIERFVLPVDGESIEAPVFETHKRGKNWSCYFTGKNAANADRHFLPQRGSVIDISRLEIGMPIEIAGDYTSSGGTPHPSRWIGVVVEKTDELLVVDRYQTVAKAISAANKGFRSVPLPEDSDVLEEMAPTPQQRIEARAAHNARSWSAKTPWRATTWNGVVKSGEVSTSDSQTHACIAGDDLTLIAPTGPATDAETIQITAVLRAAPEYLAALFLIAETTTDPVAKELAEAAIKMTTGGATPEKEEPNDTATA